MPKFIVDGVTLRVVAVGARTVKLIVKVGLVERPALAKVTTQAWLPTVALAASTEANVPKSVVSGCGKGEMLHKAAIGAKPFVYTVARIELLLT